MTATPRLSHRIRQCTAASLAVLLLALTTPPRAAAQTIVTPPGNAASEGPNGNGFPFSISPGQVSQRYQQVYDAALFSTLSPGGGMITQLWFRPDVVGVPFSSSLPAIRLDLSTTTADSLTLSTSFASNVGGNNVTVYGTATGSPLTLSSADTTGPGDTRAFDILITLSTPFFYDPAFGNLLLDVRNFGGGTTTNFDAVGPGEGVSRVYTNNTTPGGVNSLTGVVNGGPTAGLVTGFTIVPEPGSALLLLGGAALLGLRRRRRS